MDSSVLTIQRESDKKGESPFFRSDLRRSSMAIVGSSPGSETPDIHLQAKESDSEEKEDDLRRQGTNYKSSMKWNKQLVTRKRKTFNQLVIEGKSLCLFGEKNWLRLKICAFCENPYFEFVILYLIALNSILMALDSPTLEDPYSKRTI